MLFVLTNDGAALAVNRMVLAEAGRSEVGQLFYEAGTLRRANPHLMALQFLALLTAEINGRLYEREPPPLKQEEIQAMVRRAIDVFFGGTALPA